MDSQKIEKLIKELCSKKVKYRSYDGSMSETNLIERNNETILEQIIRQHILDNRDEKLGILEAKVKFYEEMISKSTFAPLLKKDEPKEELKPEAEPESFHRELIFTQRQIEHLQSKVFEITGEGEVMKLFNELLCVNVS